MTLKIRIVMLVALFAILLIVAFNALLITRQLAVITENNKFRARVGTFSAKGAFERTLSGHPANPGEALEKILPILQEGQLAEHVAVADLRGKIITTTDTGMSGVMLSDLEQQWVDTALQDYSAQNWFRADVQPSEVAFYTPLVVDGQPQYAAILRYSLGNMQEAIAQVGGLCAFAALGVIIMVTPLCLLLIHSILGPIYLLERATKDIAAGNLFQRVDLDTQDELAELANRFNWMAASLVSMKARAESANPLTRLPGNNVIHEEIEKRIKEKQKFVAVYSDLDNFKAFNDKYGIGAGDQAIKLTAQIMREAVRKGTSGDFLGHEGGDDFILLTMPEKTEEVAAYLCAEFDKKIKELYSPEDRQQGFILSKDREGNAKQFPLMTISLAGVTNAHRELTSYAEVTNICAEVKKKAKMTSKETGKSSFVLDRRIGDRRSSPRTGEEAKPPRPASNPPPAGPGPLPVPPPTPPSASNPT